MISTIMSSVIFSAIGFAIAWLFYRWLQARADKKRKSYENQECKD